MFALVAPSQGTTPPIDDPKVNIQTGLRGVWGGDLAPVLDGRYVLLFRLAACGLIRLVSSQSDALGSVPTGGASAEPDGG